MSPDFLDISRDALWRNNTGLVQFLGLCPLLAVTTTLVNGIGLGVATTIVLFLSNTAVSLARPLLRPETRIIVFVLIIAALVTVVDLFMHARFFDLHRSLGIFVPLIVTNCAIVARAEVFASRHDPLRAAIDGLMTGLGFTLVLITLGAARELVGQGTLLAQAEMLFGPNGQNTSITVFDGGFLIATLPPGAFFAMGLLIALRNVMAAHRSTDKYPAIMKAETAG
ncbi:MAG: electron transport complex subunit E [Gammaproteobacteria bacterium]|nr:electron transport complex subunit E [Gammaproteobacteria bacterium]MDH3768933.1 electron transport complex subunit E [Gammaproteobacteria bacterium]